MQGKVVSRNELMASFQKLQKQFEQQKNNIKVKETAFDQLRADFAKQLKHREETLAKVISPENPLHVLTQDLSNNLHNIFKSWECQVTNRAKGTRFRENFGDSLLVFIYGKVKSGKSSLGNYIAWGHSQPTAEHKAQVLCPEYFSAEQTNVVNGDKDKEAEKNFQFRVGATEATSSIQGFKLPGLTWVDSPGLHSVNSINGDLAKEYVDHADLILYTMHSQAPGRASDMQEITELLKNKKKLMVLLTGSDTTEEDEDEDGNIITKIIMKSSIDRQAQIEYVHNELKQLDNNTDILAEVLPVSTRYAENNPATDGIADSGIGRLFSELQTICSSQALSIKLNTPMENLKNSIRITTDDLSKVRDLVDGFAKSIEKQDQEIKQELRNLGLEGQRQMRAYINQVFNEYKTTNLQSTLHGKLNEVIQTLSQEALNKIGEKQKEGFKQVFDSSCLGELPEYQELTEDKEYYIGIKKGTKSKWASLGALAGGAVGFLVGGPAGAALGASLGSTAGAAGRSASAQYGHHKVVVGDNREEQRQAAIEHYANTLPNLLAQYIESLYGPVRSETQRYCETLKSDINKLISNLNDSIK